MSYHREPFEIREIGGGCPLKASFFLLTRMAVVMAFVLGMPVLAVPYVHDQLWSWWNLSEAPSDSQGLAVETVSVLLEDVGALAPADTGGSRIEALKHEFVARGATYMVLERIGVDGSRYRFRCNLPISQGSSYQRQFEEIDLEPDQAMSRVLKRVDAWRADWGSGQGALRRLKVELR